MNIARRASVGLEENLDGARVRVQRDWDYNLRAARSQWLKYLDSKLLVHCSPGI